MWATRLPAELHDQLVERTKQEERTPAAVMRLLARLYVESEPGAPLYPAGRPSASQAPAA